MIGKNPHKFAISSDKLKLAEQLMNKFQADQGDFDDDDPASYLKPNNKRFASGKKESDDDVEVPPTPPLAPVN